MGLFTKEEKTEFIRDEEGRVIGTRRYEKQKGEWIETHAPSESSEPKWKSTKQLHEEYYAKHPEKRHPTLRKVGHGFKRLDTTIVKYNRTRNILMQPQRKFTPHKSSPTHNNYNPFGSMFDMGMQPMKKPKKKSKPKYTVISGKAYPIAGTDKKKGKKKRRSTGFGGFDPMNIDNYGFFK